MKIVIAFYELLVDQESFREGIRQAKSARNWSCRPSDTAQPIHISWIRHFIALRIQSRPVRHTTDVIPYIKKTWISLSSKTSHQSAFENDSSEFIGPVVEWHYSRAGPIKIISRPIKQAARRGRPPHNNAHICTHTHQTFVSCLSFRAQPHVNKKVKRYLILPSLLLTSTKSRHSIRAPSWGIFLCILRALCTAEFNIALSPLFWPL